MTLFWLLSFTTTFGNKESVLQLSLYSHLTILPCIFFFFLKITCKLNRIYVRVNILSFHINNKPTTVKFYLFSLSANCCHRNIYIHKRHNTKALFCFLMYINSLSKGFKGLKGSLFNLHTHLPFLVLLVTSCKSKFLCSVILFNLKLAFFFPFSEVKVLVSCEMAFSLL